MLFRSITMVIISHDICASLKYASHILHIGAGEALFFGTKEKYLESEAGSIYAEFGGGRK